MTATPARSDTRIRLPRASARVEMLRDDAAHAEFRNDEVAISRLGHLLDLWDLVPLDDEKVIIPPT